MEAIRMTNLVKTYGSGPTEVRAIKDVSLYVNPGESSDCSAPAVPAKRRCCSAWGR